VRVCRICGGSLAGCRRQAVYCDGPCRTEASRLRAILNRAPNAPYGSLAERFEVARPHIGLLGWVLEAGQG
jgi:hypothetical protein